MNPKTKQGAYFCLNRFQKQREFILLPSGAAFDLATASLVCSDLHLGKSRYFRSRGIATPLAVDQAVLQKLEKDIEMTEAKNVYFLGDLFHSSYNSSVEDLAKIVHSFHFTSFHLIRGNHDILRNEVYTSIGLRSEGKSLPSDWINFVHEAAYKEEGKYFEIGGHLHPGVLLKSRSRQFNRLPCFYWGIKHAVLPAYGTFTGLATIRPSRGDEVFVIADNTVVRIG